MIAAEPTIAWPPKHDVLGIGISATDYDGAVAAIMQAARARVSAVVSLHAVHAVVTANRTPELRDAVNRFELVAPDGQPVRWALNRLYGTGLRDRVYGPELTLRICRKVAEVGMPIFFYGGASDELLETLCQKLRERFPGLQIADAYSPPFRPLTVEEDEALVQRINDSGAGIVFIGLGCPKQDYFAHEHRDRLQAVQVCVGAAFDFHAGRKSVAPRWMQDRGLEWLFRLCSEPRRLWRRYLVTNTLFMQKFLLQWIAARSTKSNGSSVAYEE